MVKRNVWIRTIVTLAFICFAIVMLLTNGFGMSAPYLVHLRVFNSQVEIISLPILLFTFAISIGLFIAIYFLSKKNNLEETEKKTKSIKILESITEYYSCFVLAILTVYILFVFVAFPVTVEQTSMMPNLAPDTKLIVSVGKDNLEREDIVIFNVDSSYLHVKGKDNELWIKRVIGLPGDKISFEDGKLFVNGKQYTESYLLDGETFKRGSGYDCKLDLDRKSCKSLSDVLALTGLSGDTIPEGYYLLLGDNRAYSVDSWSIGVVPRELIVGKVIYIQEGFLRFKKIK